jgi:two-component system, NarL family, sensor histidine kinase UhpB
LHAGLILHNLRPMLFQLDRRHCLPQHALRRGRYLVHVLVTMFWLICLAAPAFANVLTLRQALATEADTSEFPRDAVSTPLTLPDDWPESRPHAQGPVWYRLAFDAPGVPESGDLLALYIERVCTNVEVQLNGRRVHSGGSMVEPRTRNCEYPQLVVLPASMLRTEGNLLDIKVVGEPLARVASRQRAGGLSALQMGPQSVLAQRHARRMAFKVMLPQVVSATLLLLGCITVAVGVMNRRRRYLAYFGALSIGWAVMTARLWWRDLPLPSYDSELLLASLMPFIALAAVQFLLGYAGWRSRRIDLALYLQCAVMPLTLLLAGASRLNAATSVWYAILALEVILAAALYLQFIRRRRSNFWPTAALLSFVGAMVSIEIVAQHRMINDQLLALSHLGLPVAFVAAGLVLMQQYGRKLQDTEDEWELLESSLNDTKAELEHRFAQESELRVQQVIERERKRIAADLHDDLGAKLLTIVHTSDNERISTLAREALEEMRLSVRGLTGKPVRLIDAFGDWRAEVVSRLAQTGIEADWSAPIDEMPQTLSARAYVQTTRILRESVNNIIKHSGASHCSVHCIIADGDFQLAIQDNGKGIPLELDGRLDRGHGMSSMKQRAKQLHGQCLVESGPGYGTVIRLTLPLDRHTETA